MVGITQILVMLCDGDDAATIAGNITTSVILDGGAGTIISTAAGDSTSCWVAAGTTN